MGRRIAEPLTRRRLLGVAAGLGAAAPLLLAGCGDGDGATAPSAPGASLDATPPCDDGEPTPEQTEGPFFIPDSPRRTLLREAGVNGAPLLLTGRVVSTDCRPVRGALLDFWQADGDGVYDNDGYRLRGHQFSDARGRFRLETVAPGSYQSRTRHIHARVQARNAEVLTTQLYFPGEPGNEADVLFDPRLLLLATSDARAGFDFVLPA